MSLKNLGVFVGPMKAQWHLLPSKRKKVLINLEERNKNVLIEQKKTEEMSLILVQAEVS